MYITPTKKDLQARILKHKIKFQGYKFHLIYKPGLPNTADYFSYQMTLTAVQLSTIHTKVTELLINAIITPHLHLPDALTPEEIKKAKAIDQTI